MNKDNDIDIHWISLVLIDKDKKWDVKKNRNNKNTKTNEQIQVSSLLPLANQGKGYKIFLKDYNYKVEALKE